jgi:hypothetical protein
MDWSSLAGTGQSSTGFDHLPGPSYCAVYWNEWPIHPSGFPETKAFQQCKIRADRLLGYSASQMIFEPVSVLALQPNPEFVRTLAHD